MNPIVIETLLVAGEGDCVRVILGPYCLDFDADEVLNLEEMALPCGVIEGSAIAGRVTLKAGARLLGISSADCYRDVLWSHAVPFALAVRSTAIFEVDRTLKEREEAFFAARGLTELIS